MYGASKSRRDAGIPIFQSRWKGGKALENEKDPTGKSLHASPRIENGQEVLDVALTAYAVWVGTALVGLLFPRRAADRLPAGFASADPTRSDRAGGSPRGSLWIDSEPLSTRSESDASRAAPDRGALDALRMAPDVSGATPDQLRTRPIPRSTSRPGWCTS